MSETNIIIESINESYEWIQYNKSLRIIHSIKDDMYQMKSIIKACHSKRRPKDWFKNQSAKELLEQFDKEFGSGRILPYQENKEIESKAYEKRCDIPNELKGIYVHRLLVNPIAMWASPKYALDVFRLLDEIANKEREELSEQLNEANNKINIQKPRMVPKNKAKSYKYLIWSEEDEDGITLHFVRRNNRTYSQITNIRNNKHIWFLKEDLPIAMTPNEDIKNIIRKNLTGKEYKINGCSATIYNKECLETLHKQIESYFDSFQL